MRSWWVSCLLSCVVAIGCGEVKAVPDAGTGEDAAIQQQDDASIDAAVPRVTRVFHTVPQGSAGHLYSTDVTDGVIATAALLSGTPTNASASPSSVSVSTDSNTIIYRSDAVVAGRQALYVVRFGSSGPSAPVKISGDHGGSDSAVLFSALAADGSHAVYGWGSTSQLYITFYTSFYFVDLSGATPGTPVPIAVSTSHSFAAVSKDGSKLAFADTSGDCAIYAVDLSGTTPSTPAKVSGTTTASTSCQSVVLSPDGSRLAYVADASSDEVYELWLSNTSTTPAGAAAKVNGAIVTGGDVLQGLFGYPAHAFSADSKRLAYVADATTDDVLELWVADVSGATPGTARKASDTLVSGGDIAADVLSLGFAFSPDGKWLAYRADQRTDDVLEVFVVDVSGATPGVAQAVSGTLASGGDAVLPVFARDGSALAYVADQRTDDVFELFYVDLSNGTPGSSQVVNGALVADGDVVASGVSYWISFSPDGKRLAFTADQVTDSYNNVYVADVTGTPAPQLVHQSTTANNYMFHMQFSNDSHTLLYLTNVTGTYDIWGSEIGGTSPGTPGKINSTPGPVSGSIPQFWLAPL